MWIDVNDEKPKFKEDCLFRITENQISYDFCGELRSITFSDVGYEYCIRSHLYKHSYKEITCLISKDIDLFWMKIPK